MCILFFVLLSFYPQMLDTFAFVIELFVTTLQWLVAQHHLKVLVSDIVVGYRVNSFDTRTMQVSYSTVTEYAWPRQQTESDAVERVMFC